MKCCLVCRRVKDVIRTVLDGVPVLLCKACKVDRFALDEARRRMR